MALFMDGPACTVDDLTAHDSGLLETAQNEGIDVGKKIEQAWSDMASQLRVWLTNRRYIGASLSSRSLDVQQVVVSPELKRWQEMLSLSLVYRDAYYSHLVDRFQAKWQLYVALTEEAREHFMNSGMSMVLRPVAMAPIPNVGSVAGPQAGGTYYAGVSYLNDFGQEGKISETASITVADGYVMTVSLASVPYSGWNVYAGTSLSCLLRQNDVALGVGDVWQYIPGAGEAGTKLPSGQDGDFVLPLLRVIQRG